MLLLRNLSDTMSILIYVQLGFGLLLFLIAQCSIVSDHVDANRTHDSNLDSVRRSLQSSTEPYLKVGLFANQLANVIVDQGAVSSWAGQAIQASPENQPIYHASGGYNNGPYVQAKYKSCQAGQYLQLPNAVTLDINTNGGITAAAFIRWDTFNSFGYDRIFDFSNSGLFGQVAFYVSSRQVMLEMSNTASSANAIAYTSNPVVTLGEWVSIIATFSINGGDVKSAAIYINGVAQSVAFGAATSQAGVDRSVYNNFIFKSNDVGECLTGASLAALLIYDRYFSSYDIIDLQTKLTSMSDPYLKVNLFANQLAGVVADGGSVSLWGDQAGQPDANCQPTYYASGGYLGGSYVKAVASACYTGQYLQLLKPLTLNVQTNGGVTVGMLVRWDTFNAFNAWDHIVDFSMGGGGGGGLINAIVILRHATTNQIEFFMDTVGNVVPSIAFIHTDPDVIVLGQWMTIIATLSADPNTGNINSMLLYVNGELQATSFVGWTTGLAINRTLTSNRLFYSNDGTCLTSASLSSLMVYDRYFGPSDVSILQSKLTTTTYDPYLKVSLFASELAGVVADGAAVLVWGSQPVVATQPIASAQPIYYASGGYNNGPFLQATASACQSGQYMEIQNPIAFNVDTNGGFTVGVLFRFDAFNGHGFDRIIDFEGSGSSIILCRSYITNQLEMYIDVLTHTYAYAVTTNAAIVLGQWMSIIVTMSVTGASVNAFTIYINGVSQPITSGETFPGAARNRTARSNLIFQSNDAACCNECLTSASLAALMVYDRYFGPYDVSVLQTKLTTSYDPYLKVNLFANQLSGVVSDGGLVSLWGDQASQPDPAYQPRYFASGGHDGGSYVQTVATGCHTGQYLQLKDDLRLNMNTNGGFTIGLMMRWDAFNSYGYDRILDFGGIVGLYKNNGAGVTGSLLFGLTISSSVNIFVETSNYQVKLGEWVTVIVTALVSDATIPLIDVYINGISKALNTGGHITSQPGADRTFSSSNSYIFRSNLPNECFTSASLSSLMIYDRYFNADDAAALNKKLSSAYDPYLKVKILSNQLAGVLGDGAAVSTVWGEQASQPTADSQPIFHSTGGYNDGTYVQASASDCHVGQFLSIPNPVVLIKYEYQWRTNDRGVVSLGYV